MNIGDKIKQLRAQHTLSQKQLAQRLHISEQAVSKWETGLSAPSIEHIFAIARLFGIPADYFAEEQPRTESTTQPQGMQSVTELYKIGRGPSSSHTIGPERACLLFRERHPDATAFRAVLYGSLAKTGVGHGTDRVIAKTFAPVPCDVTFHSHTATPVHPNTMDLIAYRDGQELGRARVYSVGGGSIQWDGITAAESPLYYKQTTFNDIAATCAEQGIRLWEYVYRHEDADFPYYLATVWDTMQAAIRRGLSDDGVLPGGMNLPKKARLLYNSEHIDETAQTRENRMVCAYAFAVSEQNACGETIVTAPTCGAAGVLPAVLYYHRARNNLTDEQILHALATAGLIGNLIKTNASISGAECGCQAEIGSACAMAAAALAELYSLGIEKIEYAAEIAIEHHLGLTCDPIDGLVQIPCIERNAVAAMRAINAVNLSNFLWDTRKISFDKVVHTMKETGHDMCTAYKETSEAGLAKLDI